MKLSNLFASLWRRSLLLFALALVFAVSGAEPTTNNTLPADPTAAWAEVEKGHATLRPPRTWRNGAPTPEQVAAFQKELRASALHLAAQAKEFIRRFPTNENVGDARLTIVLALSHAVATEDPASERELERFVTETLADTRIAENDRVGVFLMAGNVALFKKAGMRFFIEGQQKFRVEMDNAAKARLREGMSMFPNSSLVYEFMVALAQRSPREEQKQIASELLASKAPASVKALAQHFLDGTRPYQVGQPVEIKFTALDGRQVDLAKLKGKLVLIDFWSTSCGPCIAEMPELKAVYEKFHDRGFEVIGISLDDKESALRRFLKEKELPWPQHFDGKGWGNQFAVRYGIFSIPTVWLVNADGILIADNARGGLEHRVESLLQKQSKNE